MKKIGFTLAEVLITLAVIGVVAALAIPALNNSIQKNKVGPTLRKFIATMEEANKLILLEKDSNTLSSGITNTQEYLTSLERHVSGVATNQTMEELELKPTNYSGGSSNAPYDMDQAFIFNMHSGESFAVNFSNVENIIASRAQARGSYKGVAAALYYDINGFNTKPNRLGKDIFHFIIDDNGAILPDGGKARFDAYTGRSEEQSWRQSSWNRCDETSVGCGHSCAGSIADNNWKVIYKY